VGLVVGIDPGDLEVPHVVYDPASGALPAQRDGTILHVRARVEDCDALLSRLRPVRICTIDMNCIHAQSLAFVRTMAPYMSIGATLVRWGEEKKKWEYTARAVLIFSSPPGPTRGIVLNGIPHPLTLIDSHDQIDAKGVVPDSHHPRRPR
jgi:hypothetical protein